MSRGSTNWPAGTDPSVGGEPACWLALCGAVAGGTLLFQRGALTLRNLPSRFRTP